MFLFSSPVCVMYTQGMENKQWREVGATPSPPRKCQRCTLPQSALRGCSTRVPKVDEQAMPVLGQLWPEGRRDYVSCFV